MKNLLKFVYKIQKQCKTDLVTQKFATKTINTYKIG